MTVEHLPSAKNPPRNPWSCLGAEGRTAPWPLTTCSPLRSTRGNGATTTVTEDYDRISMHGVRRELLERQADSLALPLHKVMIPKDCTNEIYEGRMAEAFSHFKARGVTKIAFGDLFLEDVKQYRDERLARAGMTGMYPIWMRDTDELVRTFIGLGFKAILACVDTQAIAASFAGREIDHSLLRDLPDSG